jgi:hypothetical protein
MYNYDFRTASASIPTPRLKKHCESWARELERKGYSVVVEASGGRGSDRANFVEMEIEKGDDYATVTFIANGHQPPYGGEAQGNFSEEPWAKMKAKAVQYLSRKGMKVASSQPLETLVRQKVLGAVKAPWKATLVRQTSKDTSLGKEHLVVISVMAPPRRGVSPDPTVQLAPSFSFYVSEILDGPRAGDWVLQTTRSYSGRPEKVDKQRTLKNAEDVATHMARILSTKGYETTSY